MTLKGLDVSGYQPNLPWPSFVAAGRLFVIVRVSEGYLADAQASNHINGARAAGMQVAFYHALSAGDGVTQARTFFRLAGPLDPTPFYGGPRYWVDVEGFKQHELAKVLAAFLAEWHQLTPVPIGIYTGQGEWAGSVGPGHTEFAGYPLWNGSWPLPDIWQKATIQQNPIPGLLPGYPDTLDLDEIAVSSFAYPLVPRGALGVPYIGTPGNSVRLYRQAADAGRPYGFACILNDAGVAQQLHDMGPNGGHSPHCLNFVRYYDPADDSMQGLDNWTTTDRAAWQDRVLAKIYSQLDAAHAAHVTWAAAWNEEDPPGPYGYKDLGETFIGLIQKNEARKAAGQTYVRLALWCLAQGTPELWEMEELVETGVTDLAAQLGYALCFHEGVSRPSPINYGYQARLPSDPSHYSDPDVAPWPGSGAECFRFVWLTERLLRAKGRPVPPVIIGEWYDGNPLHSDPTERLKAWSWYDDRASVYDYFAGYAGFAAWLPGWTSSDLTDLYESPEWDAWRARRAGQINGGEMQALYHAAANQDLAIRDLQGNPTTDPQGVPPAQPGQGGVVKQGRTVHVYQENVLLPLAGYAPRAVINPLTGANVAAFGLKPS